MVVPRNFPLFLLAELLVLEFPLRSFPYRILQHLKEMRFYDPLRPTQAQTLFIMDTSGEK